MVNSEGDRCCEKFFSTPEKIDLKINFTLYEGVSI